MSAVTLMRPLMRPQPQNTALLFAIVSLGCGQSFSVKRAPDAGVDGRSGWRDGAILAGGNRDASAKPGSDESSAVQTTNAEALDDLEPFSFFVTSLEIMQELSGSPDGFGGDLGGIEGADAICQQAAAKVGFGAKTWRAFLSVTDDGDGNPIHAIDRIGEGPWFDRNGRLISEDLAGLLESNRPKGDAQAVNDLPNEHGESLQMMGDTHDILTASNAQGMLDSPEPENTCDNWTSTTVMPIGGGFGLPDGFDLEDFDFTNFDFESLRMAGRGDGGMGFGGRAGGLRVGHSWPALSGQHWIASHSETSCAAGVNLVQNGPGDGSSVGAGGGWGAFYCFALTP